MNTPIDLPDCNETEWRAQEHARMAARHGSADGDGADLRVARALRQAPAVELPLDFATQVARLARMQAANNSLLEQRLLRGLSIVFVLSAVTTVAWFGRSWPAELAAALPGGSNAVGWIVIAAACALCNWGLGLLRHRKTGDSSAHR